MSSAPHSIDPSTPTDRFLPEDLTRLLAETFLDHIDYHEEIDSTNTRAKRFADTTPADRSTVLILADHQTAGRGRGTNTWWSTPGALTFSILLRDQVRSLPAERWPLLSLATGLAVCRAVESFDAKLAVRIKWPNDIYLAGKKLAGILVEAVTGQQGSIIVGIGLNINNSAATAPPGLRERVTALCDATQREIPRIDVLTVLLRELADGLKDLMSGGTHWQEDFAARSLLTGRKVEIDVPTGRIEGICEGIDQDGALLVVTPTGQERIVSGTVTRIE